MGLSMGRSMGRSIGRSLSGGRSIWRSGVSEPNPLSRRAAGGSGVGPGGGTGAAGAATATGGAPVIVALPGEDFVRVVRFRPLLSVVFFASLSDEPLAFAMLFNSGALPLHQPAARSEIWKIEDLTNRPPSPAW